MTGHLLGGAGAVESVAAILALRDKVAPPTINLEDPDDDAGLTISAEPPGAQARGHGPDGRPQQLLRVRRRQRRPRVHHALTRT